MPLTLTFSTSYGIADVVLDADHGGEVVDEVGLGDQAFEDLEVEDAVAHVVEAAGAR